MTAHDAIEQAKKTYSEITDGTLGDPGTQPGKAQAVIAIARFLMENDDATIKP